MCVWYKQTTKEHMITTAAFFYGPRHQQARRSVLAPHLWRLLRAAVPPGHHGPLTRMLLAFLVWIFLESSPAGALAPLASSILSRITTTTTTTTTTYAAPFLRNLKSYCFDLLFRPAFLAWNGYTNTLGALAPDNVCAVALPLSCLWNPCSHLSDALASDFSL